MEPTDIANLQAAVDALNELDIEPLLTLMAGEMEWRGAPHGRLWWRHTPS